MEWATFCLPSSCWCVCVIGISICFKRLIVLSRSAWRLKRRIGKSSSDINVWIVFYPSMFLDNLRENMKARVDVSVVLCELGDFFLLFPAKRRWKFSRNRLYCIRKIETREARQAKYLARHVGAEVGKFLKFVVIAFSERGKRVHSL